MKPFDLEEFKHSIKRKAINGVGDALEAIADMEEEDKIEALNEIRLMISDISPFRDEPIDRIQWVKAESVGANDYNPNSVAPPEMELLQHSILMDGYTQPIVAFHEGDGFTVIDGFHRNRVGKECADVRERVKGYLPITIIRSDREDRSDRIASTIRHNRARGKHAVESMSDIVVELKRRNWTDVRISKELGMEQDEILRLCQITGMEELFADRDFSKAWDVEGEVSPDDFVELTDNVDEYGDEVETFRDVHTGGDDRIFHTYENWECYKAGFYKTTVDGMNAVECQEAYRAFLSDIPRFERALDGVTTEWVKSCEHYLTNTSMNRIAWLGQASACYELGIPSTFRGGFNLLEAKQQEEANQAALKYLNKWLSVHGKPELTLEEALSGRQADIY